MYDQNNHQSPENWQRKAIENGWTPPEKPEGKDPAGIGGYQKFVLLILAVIVLSTWLNNRKVEQSKSTIPTKAATAQTDATKPYVIPGSAKEAVMNGELEMADIKHRADAIGWSTDAWQEWEGGRWGWSGAAGEMEIIRCILRNSAGTGIPANTAAGRHHPDSG